jgi:hypothetical protein
MKIAANDTTADAKYFNENLKRLGPVANVRMKKAKNKSKGDYFQLTFIIEQNGIKLNNKSGY